TTSAGGYGWYAQNQRHTSAATAELTLMGVRLYNRVRGLFTATDPIPGGNTNTYTHPTDPINQHDLDGKRGWWKRNWRTVLQVGLTVGCVVASAGACLAAGALASAVFFAADWRSKGLSRATRGAAANLASSVVPFGRGAFAAVKAAKHS